VPGPGRAFFSKIASWTNVSASTISGWSKRQVLPSSLQVLAPQPVQIVASRDQSLYSKSRSTSPALPVLATSEATSIAASQVQLPSVISSAGVFWPAALIMSLLTNMPKGEVENG